MEDNKENTHNIKVSPKQDLINHLIWIVIANSIFAHFGKQMESGKVSSLGQVIWFIASFFLFGALFALTGVFNRFVKNKVVSFFVALVVMFAINFLLLAIIP